MSSPFPSEFSLSPHAPIIAPDPTAPVQMDKEDNAEVAEDAQRNQEIEWYWIVVLGSTNDCARYEGAHEGDMVLQ